MDIPVVHNPIKDGLIGIEAAADYLGCSQQYLSKMLNNEKEEHLLRDHFRHYAGRWRTTYALLDEYFQTKPTLYTRNNSNGTEDIPERTES